MCVRVRVRARVRLYQFPVCRRLMPRVPGVPTGRRTRSTSDRKGGRRRERNAKFDRSKKEPQKSEQKHHLQHVTCWCNKGAVHVPNMCHISAICVLAICHMSPLNVRYVCHFCAINVPYKCHTCVQGTRFCKTLYLLSTFLLSSRLN